MSIVYLLILLCLMFLVFPDSRPPQYRFEYVLWVLEYVAWYLCIVATLVAMYLDSHPEVLQ